MDVMEIAKTLSRILEERTGCKFGPEYIRTDASGLSANYIPVRGLHYRRPLIIMHYMGIRLVFLPYMDWNDIVKGEITVQDYVDKAVWNYGYYWGFNTLQSGGVHWQPLEDGKPGINDKEKVKRYLTILRCRAHEQYKNEQPMLVWCSDCHLQKCPMSVIPRKKDGASWCDEVHERHVRKEYYEAIGQMLKERFGLEVCALDMSKEFDDSRRNIYLFKGYEEGTVKIFVSEALILNMMYYSEKFDIEKLLGKVILIAGIKKYDKTVKDFVLDKEMIITGETTVEEIISFWNEN